MSAPAVLVEACVDSLESARAAHAGGAARLELCADLVEGGTTPSAGTIHVARERVPLELFVFVRPRAGDFVYTDDEMDVMLRDIAVAAAAGADGVVIGALTPEATVDAKRTRRLLDAARPMRVTFHRAFDLTRDVGEALDALVALGVDRVLTSGGAPTARAGVGSLAALVHRAGDAITILAGGGVTEETAAEVVAGSGVREIHVRCAERVESVVRHRVDGVAFGKPYTPDEYGWMATSAARIRRVVRAVGGE